MSVDERIENLGFKVCITKLDCRYIIYRNKKYDQEVSIQWSKYPENCYINSHCISTKKDCLTQSYNEPMSLNILEASAFMDKINEMRKGD